MFCSLKLDLQFPGSTWRNTSFGLLENCKFCFTLSVLRFLCGALRSFSVRSFVPRWSYSVWFYGAGHFQKDAIIVPFMLLPAIPSWPGSQSDQHDGRAVGTWPCSSSGREAK